MAGRLTALGVHVLPSRGDFLFVDCGQPYIGVAERLIDLGVIVKPCKQEGYEHSLRVSVGLDWENGQFLEATARIL
ncbi:hypothetical protein [Ponticoccus alexandrii]|uniref:Aminotransferase class I/classII domain-containing protein n=1 Tax=Ponticoccus alexandrii TaxID=1943633 RepID=A0ABX7FGV2_9RHOB|nr:hypothetical protein [Ponticoccus alexandrii]ETA49420.1 hypothetical protein P279_24855 [Rhodobacteraceae bacterium PD-2]QRF69325.1 hypothetical protein GQA70_23630 [Ponticoccus alexandrii]